MTNKKINHKNCNCYRSTKHSCGSASKCRTDKIDTSLCFAKFEEDKRNPIHGKNVLIIGGSKGVGLGANIEMSAAGANVIATSRNPSSYTDVPNLSSVPLDIRDGASVENFFNLLEWTKINVLILGGFTAIIGTLAKSNASDLFPFINTEILGRQRVVVCALPKMKDVDDSRIINLGSIGSIMPILSIAPYSMVKGAIRNWTKQWNLEKEYYKKISGKYLYKTTAITWEASWISTEAINASPPQFSTGLSNPLVKPELFGQLTFNSNNLSQGMTIYRAGKSLLHVATVCDPEWQYIVLNDNEKWGGEDVETLLLKASQHKIKKAFTDNPIYAPRCNYNEIIADAAKGNPKTYSMFRLPKECKSAPKYDVDDIKDLKCNDTTLYPDQTIPPNIVKPENVKDLVENPCKISDKLCKDD